MRHADRQSGSQSDPEIQHSRTAKTNLTDLLVTWLLQYSLFVFASFSSQLSTGGVRRR